MRATSVVCVESVGVELKTPVFLLRATRLATASRRGSQSAWKKGAWGWKKDTCVFTSCYSSCNCKQKAC
nr:hypothetical protein [Campylobacter troglodytis]